MKAQMPKQDKGRGTPARGSRSRLHIARGQVEAKAGGLDERIAWTAYFAWKAGFPSQQELASALNIDQRTVSRHLHAAAEAGLIKTEFLASRLPPEMRTRLASRTIDNKLFDALGPLSDRFRGVWVCEDRRGEVERADGSDPKRFAWAAAFHVQRFLTEAQTIGTCWGATISSVVSELEASGWRRDVAAGQVIPMAGMVHGKRGTTRAIYDASSLAAQMAELTRAREVSHLGPMMAYWPSRLPKGLLEQQRYLFGDGGAASGCDCVLTSLSGKLPLGTHFHNIEECATKRQIEVIMEYAAGDFAGVIMAKEGAPSHARTTIDAINKRWTGATMKTYREIADRTVQSRNFAAGGVVAIAYGEEKAPMLIASVKQGLLNHAIVDQGIKAAVLGILSR